MNSKNVLISLILIFLTFSVSSEELNEGLSEKEIYSYFKEKYGDWILYDPGLNKHTYLLWLLPILIFLFGGAIIAKSFILKK